MILFLKSYEVEPHKISKRKLLVGIIAFFMMNLSQKKLRYRNVAAHYDFMLTLTGFKRGMESFLDRLNFNFPAGSRILDAGCGTGIITRYLLKRFPDDIEVIATDIAPEMLRAMRRALAEEGLAQKNIRLGESDMSIPARVFYTDTREWATLPEGRFDGIFVSGSLEHVPLEASIVELAKLLKPGGAFLNVSVRDNIVGAVLCIAYKFRPYAVSEMVRACERAGFVDIRVEPLSPREFPANLSRVAIIARKPL